MLTTDNSIGECWYALYTRPRHEKRVREELTTKGFQSYLPVFHEWHTWKDRTKRVEQPVFPNYVFIKFCDDPNARVRVLQTMGIVHILGSGGRAIEPVPESEIESVRRMLVSSQDCTPHPFLQEGARVVVRRGPLKDIEGFLVEFKSRGRLVVSVNLLSQSVATEVALCDVALVRNTQ